MLADLRQSGEIEANTDNVVLLYRPGPHRSSAPEAGLIELIIAKQRNGPTGVVKARWDGPHQRLLPLV